MDVDPSIIVGITLPLFFLVVFGGIFAFLVYAGNKGKEAAAALARAQAAASPGHAVVTQLTTKQFGADGPSQITTHAYVELNVESQPPVRTRAVWRVDPAHLPRLQPGARLNVLIDAKSPARVFPAEPWLKSSGLDPNIQFA